MMPILRAWSRRVHSMFRKEQLDRELDAEFASHLEMHVADNLRAGMTPEAARRDVRVSSLEGSTGAEMYLLATNATPEGSQLVVRSKLPSDVLTAEVIATLRKLNPAQPATAFRPIQTLVDHAVSPRRFFVLLVGIFAALGLVLAALGIYGVISYSVTRQTQEIGIRLALGATPASVQIRVLSRTMRLALVGVAVGVVGSIAASKVISSLLFKTEPTDPTTFGGVLILLLAVAVLAGYVPALRATRIDPIIALRYE
jgi:ABC-type antimicrobial peptide transport system permease subunit